MPCILPSGELNGISVPAICARHGGQWVGEQQPSLMNSGVNPEWDKPAENLTPWLIPGAGTAKSTATYLGTKVLPKVLPKVKSVAQSLFTKPGQVQKTVPIIKKVSPAVTKKAGILMKPIPTTGQKMATKKITTDGRVISAPGVIGGGLVTAPIVKSIFSDEPVTDKKVVNQTAKGTPWADLAKGVKPDARDDMAFEGALMNNPEAIKEMAKSGEMSEGLLSKMGTKDYWMTGIEGGSGAWDNKLFRLGEMMAYMGTPLSKRGDSPAKRWTAANTDSAKVSKALTAAQSKLEKGKIDNLMKIASTSPKDLAASIVEYLPDELDNTWLGLSDKEKSSMSMSIAIRASQAMKLAGADGKHMPYSVAMKLAANQILKEHNKK